MTSCFCSAKVLGHNQVLFLLLNVVTPQKPARPQYHSDCKAAMKTNADPLLN